jgi:hypothetical protein
LGRADLSSGTEIDECLTVRRQRGQHAGDDVFSCVILPASPAVTLANCTAIFRLPGGNITAQTTAVPGPAPKQLALTGGTSTYRTIGGDGTLVEFAVGNRGS